MTFTQKMLFELQSCNEYGTQNHKQGKKKKISKKGESMMFKELLTKQYTRWLVLHLTFHFSEKYGLVLGIPSVHRQCRQN